MHISTLNFADKIPGEMQIFIDATREQFGDSVKEDVKITFDDFVCEEIDVVLGETRVNGILRECWSNPLYKKGFEILSYLGNKLPVFKSDINWIWGALSKLQETYEINKDFSNANHIDRITKLLSESFFTILTKG